MEPPSLRRLILNEAWLAEAIAAPARPISPQMDPVQQVDPVFRRLLGIDGPSRTNTPNQTPTPRLTMTSSEQVVEPIGHVVNRLVEHLGGTRRLSEVLSVSRSQVRRWHRLDSRPSQKNAELLRDLDHVFARALLLWGAPEVVVDWLVGANAFLGWASPCEVIRIRGVSEVLDAIEEASRGGYA